MKKLLLFVTITLFGFNGIFAQHNIGYDGKNYYFTDRLLVVLEQNSYSENGNSVILENSLNKSLQTFAPASIKKMFNIKAKESASGSLLNRVYLMEFSNNIDIKLFAAKIGKLKGIEIVEPYYLNESFYTPNDPSFAQQYALSKINAADAWDITKGDKSIIIGIVDTGVDWDHPDLAANIWTNPNEIANNGIDDDNNGMIDDIRGWDFGGLTGVPDNDPMEDRPDHGTLVAGCAAAVTDNGVGISGIGYNSTIMPVKTSQDNIRTDTGKALISYGYQGILYAAENGASVINCSWGNYAYSTINSTIIEYIITVLNISVVAAMGNDNLDATMYPANYKGVLSVSATSTDDTRSSFSNYGYGVDVCAPGTAILSTWMNDVYTSASGTSLSSPIVAGLCALVKNKFPLYTALQVNEQVRTNCDDIYSVNSAYDKKLGRGRINAFNAVNNVNSKSLRLYQYEIEETTNDGVYKPGENLKLTVHLLNYLAPLPLVNVSVSTSSPYATITSNSFSASSIGMLEIFDNGNSRFSIDLANNTPANTTIDLVLNYSSTGYTDFEVIQILVNPTFATQTTDNIEFTVTNKGTIGFNDYPDNNQGIGFKLSNSSNLLFEGGLLFGTSSSKVVDCLRGTNPDVANSDLSNVLPFILSVPGLFADVQGHMVINDDNAGSNKIGTQITLDTYTYNETGLDYSAIFRYVFKNTSGSDISDFYAGLFFDWDIDESTSGNNTAYYDTEFKCAIFSHPTLNYYIGMGLGWRWGSDNFYAITNDGSDGGINIYDNFTKQEKWTALSSGLSKTTAGPGDVSGVISAGPFSIPSQGEREIAIVVTLAPSIDQLKESIELGRAKYFQLPTDVNEETNINPVIFNLEQNFPNPFNPITSIKFSLPVSGFTQLKIYDILGNEIKSLVNGELEQGNYSLTWDATNNKNQKVVSGIYIYELKSNGLRISKKMTLLK